MGFSLDKIKVQNMQLNDINAQVDSMDLRFAKREDIVLNERNFYEITDIDSIKKSIEDVGLQQPLVVTVLEDDKYKLLSGERRFTAICQLIDEGKWNQPIPVVVVDLNKIDLPLNNEDKEMYSLITTNKEQRIRSEMEQAREYLEIKRIFKALKRDGVKTVKLPTGEEVQLKGKVRELAADVTKVSSSTAGKYDMIDKRGSDELQEQFFNGKISTNAAVDVARHSDEEQKDIINKAKEIQKDLGEEDQPMSNKIINQAINNIAPQEKKLTNATWDEWHLGINKIFAENSEIVLDEERYNALKKYTDNIFVILLNATKG